MPSFHGIWIASFSLVFHLCHIATASHESGPMQLDLTVSPQTSHSAANHLLLRDAAPINVPAIYDTQMLSIYVNATLGTPPQQIYFNLATNAADMVVLAANNSRCASHACGDTVFEASQSSTYKFLNSNFSTLYVDGSNGTGFYATDNFVIAGTSVPNLQFGYLLTSSVTEAILGVGYVSLEYAASSYANLPYRLYNQKSINVNAFSIWFEDEDSTTGKLSFGGIDTGKFNGSLESFTVAASGLSYQYTTITMSGVSGTVNGNVTSFAGSSASVAIDTSATALYLPNRTINQIAQFMGATYAPSLYGLYVLPYSAIKNGSTIDITLGSTIIHIPLEYLTDTLNATHAIVWMSDAGSNSNLLGVPFLRSAYTVFDYTHNQLSFAPLLKSNQSNITSISSNGVAGMASTFKANTTSTTNNPPSTTTSTPSGTTSTSSTPSAHGLSSSAKLGIGLGVGLGVPALLAAIAAILLLRHRKQRQNSMPQGSYPPTAERHNYPGSPSTGNTLGGLMTRARGGDDSSVPELDGGRHQYDPRFGSPDMSAPSTDQSGSIFYTHPRTEPWHER